MRFLSTLASVLSRFLEVFFSIVCTYYYGRGAVSRIEDPLLRESASAIARKLKLGQVQSRKVVQACIARIREVDKQINAVVDEFFEEALRQAEQVDAELQRLQSDTENGQSQLEALYQAKPFYGVPTSIKSCFAVQGGTWDAGLLSRKGVRATYDCNEVRRLREAGFIVLCTSAVPELLAWLETTSVARGRTLNPYNFSRGAGGSSGGEAALIAAGATPVGLGSDSGGSIRIPAAFCGVFGHKPTHDESTKYSEAVRKEDGGVAGAGHYPPPFSKRQERMLAFGPICRHAEDLWPTLLASLSESDRARISGNGERYPAVVNWSKTKFLLIPALCDGAKEGPTAADHYINAPDRLVSEALERVVQFVQKELKTEVTTLRFLGDEFTSVRLTDAVDAFMAYSYLPDGFANVPKSEWRTVEGKPWDCASMWALHSDGNPAKRVSATCELLKKLFFWLPLQHRITLPILLSAITESSFEGVSEAQHLQAVRAGELLEAAFQKLFSSYKQAGFEHVIIICPAMPHVAPFHGKPVLCSPFDAMYTALFNVTGLPCTVAPVLRDRAKQSNLPACVQIVTDKFDDVASIAFAELLEKVFGGWREPHASD